MNFEEAILQKIKEQGLKDSELSLPDPKKSPVEQFSENLSLEELALRKDYIPEAVVNCKRSTEDLQNEKELIRKHVGVFKPITNNFVLNSRERIVELGVKKDECLS